MNNVVIANNYMHDMQSSTNALFAEVLHPAARVALRRIYSSIPETTVAFPACRFITTWSRFGLFRRLQRAFQWRNRSRQFQQRVLYGVRL